MYYAFLGHQPQLALLELASLTHLEPSLVLPNIASIPLTTEVLKIADKLGGTSKIARTLSVVSEGEVLDKLVELITASESKNVALSNFSSLELTPQGVRGLKEQVTTSRPIRFVSFLTKDHELLMLKKKHVAEFNLIPFDNQIAIAETVWIYDSLSWASRDRRRPYQNIKKGMLPLKLARQMVNLATLGQENLTVFDPFCGTGTILAEALLVNCPAVGSDQDPESIKGSEANLTWLSEKIKDLPSFRFFQADATHVADTLKSVDCIVTEPYLGPLLDSRNPLSTQKIANIAKGLEKLYRGALKNWLKILPENSKSRVVIILPEFHLGKRIIPTLRIDTIEALGYNYVSTVAYHKPGATVVRNITILEKK